MKQFELITPEINLEDFRNSLEEIFDNNTLMSLATSNNSGLVSCCNVFFAYDSDYNLYFMTSDQDASHVVNVKTNPRVAITIADSKQSIDQDTKLGVQIYGKCERPSLKEGIKGFGSYAKRFGSFGMVIKVPADFIKNELNIEFFVIKSESFKIFDQKRFGHHGWVTAKLK